MRFDKRNQTTVDKRQMFAAFLSAKTSLSPYLQRLGYTEQCKADYSDVVIDVRDKNS